MKKDNDETEDFRHAYDVRTRSTLINDTFKTESLFFLHGPTTRFFSLRLRRQDSVEIK